MAQKVTSTFFGPPTIDERFWEAYAAWCWGQREYAVNLMTYLIEDEVEQENRHKNKDNPDGQTLETPEETGAPWTPDYAWNGWKFND